MNSTLKAILITLGVVAVLLAVLFIFVPISLRNSAADAEVLVVQAKDNCVSTYDNGIKAVIEMAQVDQNTKDYLIDLIDRNALPAGQQAEMQQAYEGFVNGDPAQLMLLLGAIGNTNFTATAENVQREVAAQRGAMLTCSTALNGAQANLKNVLGMDAGGNIVKWPQTLVRVRPSSVNDASLRDNDNDGILTVLDYRPPADVDIRGSFGTGEGIPPVDLYGDE